MDVVWRRLVVDHLTFVVGGFGQRTLPGSRRSDVIRFIGMYLLARNSQRATAWFQPGYHALAGAQSLGQTQFMPSSRFRVITDAPPVFARYLLSLLDWGIAVLQYYWFLLAFFPNGKLLWASFLLGVSSLGIAAPSSPGSLGVFELIVVGTLSLFG